MFDDVKNKKEIDNIVPANSGHGNKAPLDSNQTGQAEDIFANTDTEAINQPAKPEAFQPKAKESADSVAGNKQNKSMPVNIGDVKKYVILGVIVLGLVLAGYAGYWVYGKYFKAIPASEEISEEISEQPDSGAPEKSTQPEIKSKPVFAQPKDNDQDGLTDEEEKQLGTDPDSVDSDGDGLFDREEVEVYQTDPLNPDTDGDGFSDGDEVKDGYNPKGTGKLY